MEKFRVAAVQMNAAKDDLEHNLQVHTRFIAKAARAGCRLILFPELSVTAHYGDAKVVQFAERAGSGRIFRLMHEEAKKHKIIIAYGFCEIAHGTHYNSQALVGPEGMIGVQRKVHASNDEYFSFRMGRSLDVFDLGFARVGTLICFDSSFCEAWRVLMLKGAEVILLPHAGRSGPGIKIPLKEQMKNIKGLLKAAPGDYGTHARANGVFGVYCNQVGFNGHSTHGGGAYIIGPSGELLKKSKASLDDLWISAELDPQLQERVRQGANFVPKMRRPEIYRDLTKMI